MVTDEHGRSASCQDHVEAWKHSMPTKMLPTKVNACTYDKQSSISMSLLAQGSTTSSIAPVIHSLSIPDAWDCLSRMWKTVSWSESSLRQKAQTGAVKKRRHVVKDISAHRICDSACIHPVILSTLFRVNRALYCASNSFSMRANFFKIVCCTQIS